VIDLHRHPIAYFLYTTLGKIVLHNRLLRHDGALSILRSFKVVSCWSWANARVCGIFGWSGAFRFGSF
jgi:hypothetical protein